jgi:hypothetical protein
MSEHFGNLRALSMEGSSVHTFILVSIERYWQGGLPQNCSDDDIKMKFHSHFSDDKTKIAAATHAHMDVLLKSKNKR